MATRSGSMPTSCSASTAPAGGSPASIRREIDALRIDALRISGVDPEGVDLRLGGRVARLAFAQSIRDAAGARAELVRLGFTQERVNRLATTDDVGFPLECLVYMLGG